MAIAQTITGVLVGEDKVLDFDIGQDTSTWTVTFSLATPVPVSKSTTGGSITSGAAPSGADNGLAVTLDSVDTSQAPGSYRYELRRTDVGHNSVLAFGRFLLGVAAPQRFATTDELEAWMGLSIVNTARAEALLDAASEEIRGAIGQQIDAVEDDVVTLLGSGGASLFLPQTPVSEVSQVDVDGTTLDPTGYSVDSIGILRRVSPDVWVRGTSIEVTYTHGYDTVPEDIAGVCKDMVSRAMAAQGLGQSEEGLLGNVAIAEAIGFGPTIVLLPSERKVLDRYRVGSWD